jgi:transketolase N-terminal domain/subunit
VKAVSKDYETLGEPSVPLEAIQRFRQLGSRCPGHPEYRWTSGVETTTGPLGQGVATSVGMAIAGRWMAAHFNRPGFPMFDFDVFALAGDGCMMEGVSSEAASLAGHLKLANLCWIYDNNKITIEGHTEWAFSEDVATRFIAYGWNVTRVGDANDLEMLERAFRTFKVTPDRPTLIIVDSHIAYGSPNKQDTHAAHGEPLGAEEIKLTKRAYGWPEDAQFLVPEGVREHFAGGMGKRSRKLRDEWMELFARYKEQYPAEAEVAGKRGGLVLDALLHVAVGRDHVRVVIDDVVARLVEAGGEHALGERDPDGGGDALAERPGRRLDPGQVAVLGVAGGRRAELAEVLQVVERDAVAAEEQRAVEQHRRVPGAEDEPVAVGPVRVRRGVLHHSRVERVGQRRERHRRARVAGVGLLHAVHRERADRVDAELIERRRVFCDGHAAS